jgi:oligopeptide transport system substrate-binding protein
LFTLSDVEYTEFSTVGIFANNDYSITKVYVEPITKFGAWMSNTTPELVHKATYEGAIIDPNAALLQTKYGTTNVLSNYMAYGPYKMTSYQIGKQFVFERNENWYGYSEFDTEHKNTYATKGIIINVIEQPEQQLLSFLNGDLDDVMLDAQNMSTYRHSPYLQYTPTDYTRAFFLNSDLDALQQLDANNDGNINSIALTNESFRRALSFAINRQEYCDNTAGDIPAYSLFNRLYTYNMEEEMQTGIDYRYRDLTVAKEAILGIYGIKYGATEYYKTLDDAYEAVTGLDVELATSLLNKAYLELVEAGIGFDTSKPVVIKIAISVKTNQVTAAFNKINENLAVAAAATPFKGVSFELQVDPDRYNSLLDGTVAAISGAWGGATMRPFYIISCYTDPASRLEYGFNPEETDLTLFVDFDGDGEDEEITLDLDSWQNAINNGIYSAVDEDDYKDNEGVLDEEAFAAEEARLLQLRLYVLSKLEEYILSTAHTIPISSETDISLLGKKISTPVEEYSSYKGWGGLRDYTYNYTDEEWASYVQSIGGTVDYV